ncbi:hypothetical protein Q7284_10430 [Glaesserella parasuis]|nr:hypothetical protein [Glaesserella parasuis]MDP0059123.1 hypothetical protein [Glaesserella parasuis]MDP0076297.1 hypothetical protein [Glaesserella parasuis]MDP0084666.1 hypothetical protein [Glaesserella parasuis]MDP0090940.1 hypothetical protein [Glaesserella parasuis]MDP0118673.1 hypothetical protein [Glaesserella parasuis]
MDDLERAIAKESYEYDRDDDDDTALPVWKRYAKVCKNPDSNHFIG